MKQSWARLIRAYSRPFALCSFAPRRCALCVMPCSHVCTFCVCHVRAFFVLSYLLPNFIWLYPKPLSIIDVFCRLSKYCCLVWGGAGFELHFLGGVNIFIICMKSLLSSSALSVCRTDSSREVNECHCISEEELFHAITLKVHERTEWKEWGRERKRAWERIITTLQQVYPIVFENLSLWQVPFVKGVDR